MKKILAIVLAAVMLLSMTACGAAAKKDTYVVGICQLPGQRQGPAHGRTPE